MKHSKNWVRELGMRRKEEYIIDKTQPEAGFLKSGVKEPPFKEAHEQVGIGGGHSCVHGSYLDLEVILGVDGEMVMDEDKLGKLYKGLSGL